MHRNYFPIPLKMHELKESPFIQRQRGSAKLLWVASKVTQVTHICMGFLLEFNFTCNRKIKLWWIDFLVIDNIAHA